MHRLLQLSCIVAFTAAAVLNVTAAKPSGGDTAAGTAFLPNPVADLQDDVVGHGRRAAGRRRLNRRGQFSCRLALALANIPRADHTGKFVSRPRRRILPVRNLLRPVPGADIGENGILELRTIGYLIQYQGKRLGQSRVHYLA